MVIDLDILNIGELFEILHDRLSDRIQGAIGLASAGEVHVCHTIGVFDLVVTGKTVEHEGKPLFTFQANWSLEVFIEHRADDIARGRNEARGGSFIGELTADQFVVVCKVNTELHIYRRASGCWCERRSRRAARGKGRCDGEGTRGSRSA